VSRPSRNGRSTRPMTPATALMAARRVPLKTERLRSDDLIVEQLSSPTVQLRKHRQIQFAVHGVTYEVSDKTKSELRKRQHPACQKSARRRHELFDSFDLIVPKLGHDPTSALRY
jgi:hypothetical protein